MCVCVSESVCVCVCVCMSACKRVYLMFVGVSRRELADQYLFRG